MQIKIDYTPKSLTFKEYDEMFQAMPVQLQQTAYRKAGGKVAELVKRIAIAISPSRKNEGANLVGGLANTSYKDSFEVHVAGRRRRGGGSRRSQTSARVSADAWVTNSAPHAHLVEWGSRERRTARGRSTGRMPAMRVMQTASESVVSVAPNFYEKAIRNAVRQVARQMRTGRLTKKVGRALGTLSDR